MSMIDKIAEILDPNLGLSSFGARMKYLIFILLISCGSGGGGGSEPVDGCITIKKPTTINGTLYVPREGEVTLCQ